MKISDLPRATLTMAEAAKKYQSMDPRDRTAIISLPFEDLDERSPTEDQLIRVIEHWKECLRLVELDRRALA